MWFIVILGGERLARLRSSYMLFLYTFIFSFLTLLSLIFVKIANGTTGIFSTILGGFGLIEQLLMFFGFLIGFSVKVPVNPVHVWLPHAHV